MSILINCGRANKLKIRLDALREKNAPETHRRAARGAAVGVRPGDGGAVGKAAHRFAAANQPLRVAFDYDGAGSGVRTRRDAPADQSAGRGLVALARADARATGDGRAAASRAGGACTHQKGEAWTQ